MSSILKIESISTAAKRTCSNRRRERKYKCSFCPKMWPSHAHRRRHELSHTQAQPFKCHICPNRFNQLSNLHVHLRGKHRLQEIPQRDFRWEAFEQPAQFDDEDNHRNQVATKSPALCQTPIEQTNTLQDGATTPWPLQASVMQGIAPAGSLSSFSPVSAAIIQLMQQKLLLACMQTAMTVHAAKTNP
eukprot:TRINITY_DN21134_c0_g1_i1.p1 TRINITY_DN21134_c0_g1~~TRINITY_DN21134_c0_g1_i1.p1  ORF type:complete len:188 (+),score=30.13 TRINITY_DN21134_c0_g1_i1:104-667(+)